MSRTARTIVILVIAAVVIVVAALGYLWFSGGSGAPSATLSAPTLAIVTTAPTEAPTTAPATAATAEATAEATTEATEAMSAATAEATEMSAASAETTAEATEASAASASSLKVFNIASDQSKVSFTLTEELRGTPTTVVGTTNQVAGQIAVDFSNPKASQVGEIRINARTLATDQEMRNRTIRSAILQSSQDQYEFINFQPTALSGLPDTVTVGEPYSFQITGDLTIRDITRPVTFDVTVTPRSETEISGTAKTTVQRGDFELVIPNVPMVANVSEAVDLQIDFVALPA